MNRLFKRDKNYKKLSILLAIAMLFSILPSNMVNADTSVVATATTLVAESGNGFKNDTEVAGKVVFDPEVEENVGKLRARVEFPSDYVPTLGDVVTINYETNISSLSAEFGYDYDSSNARTMTSDQTSITFSLEEKDITWFSGNTAGYEAAVRFKQSNCPEDSYLTVSSVTVTREVVTGDDANGEGTGDDANGEGTGDDTNGEGTGDNAGGEGTAGDSNGGTAGDDNADGTTIYPTMTLGWFDASYSNASADYPDDLFAAKYTDVVQWSSVAYAVTDHDVTVYNQLQIDLTPSREGMALAVLNQEYGHVDEAQGWLTLSAGRQTVTLNLNQSITQLAFQADANVEGGYVGTEEVTFIVHSVKFVKANNSGTPDTPSTPTTPSNPEKPTNATVDTVLSRESQDFYLDEQGRLYAAAGGKLRGALDFPEDFRVEAGGVLTINYDTDLPSFVAEFTYGNGGNPTSFTETFTSGQNSLEIKLTDAWVDYFAGNTDYANNPTRARLKVDSTTGTYIAITSVIYTAPSEDDTTGDDNNSGSTPTVPSWQVNNGPIVTVDTVSEIFTCKTNEDKSVDVSFTAPAGWTPLRANIENCDYTKYSHVKIDITPAEGLYLYVYGDVDGDISGKYEFDEAKRTTIEFDLKRDTKYFDLWCNPQDGMGTAGKKDFTIHSIKIVDPAMPEGNYIDAPLTVESDAFTMEGTDTVVAPNGGKLRARITLPMDFRVEEGKQLAFYYDTNIDGLDIDFTWNWTDSSLSNSTFNVEKKSHAFIIDQSWIDYINNNTSGTNPTVRLKLDSTPAGSYFTLKAVVYGDVPAQQYDPNQVPQGLVVTYYNDIYSRGVAWNTEHTVKENALYYVKATDDMTTENVDWTSDAVKKVNATFKDTKDTTGKTWRTFKAHVENLDAGAKYFYRAGSEETGWSEVGSFTIEKAKEEITGLSFIHVTDSQEESSAGFQKWARVLKDAYTRVPNAAFVAHTGDVVNRSENINNFYLQEWIYAFDEPKSQIMNGVFAPASGNHETLDYVFTDRFDIDWADYKEGDEELRYGGCYVVTYGEPENGLVLISLNNTAEAWNYESDFQLYQQVWMVEQLEKYSDYKWKVIQLHEGLMTAGDHTNDGEVDLMRDTLPPIFAKYKVDLVLQGHDHVYTRTRSYAYGENVFDPGTKENPNYFNGHTPVWTENQKLEPGESSKDGSVTNTLDRTIYLEPQGTHYITINSCGTKQYPEEPADRIDEVIFEGDNPINPVDANGNGGSMCQPGLPMYGLVKIEGDFLIYDSYTYNHNTRTSELYDSFAVNKNYKSGYNTENPHEGKEEVQLYGIKMESKKYDGYAPKLDLSGFVASIPAVMDVTSFKYTVTSYGDDGASYNKTGTAPLYLGSNGKGILPTQKGEYVLTVEIPQSNRFYWGSTSVRFSIK